MKEHLKSIVTLTLICAVIAVSMAGVNYITDPYIKAAEDKAANVAENGEKSLADSPANVKLSV